MADMNCPLAELTPTEVETGFLQTSVSLLVLTAERALRLSIAVVAGLFPLSTPASGCSRQAGISGGACSPYPASVSLMSLGALSFSVTHFHAQGAGLQTGTGSLVPSCEGPVPDSSPGARLSFPNCPGAFCLPRKHIARALCFPPPPSPTGQSCPPIPGDHPR